MSAPAAKTVTRTPFKKWCDENVGLLFLIPWIIGFVVFKLYPFATSLFYSFTDTEPVLWIWFSPIRITLPALTI